ncbi:hypothetical protein CPB85DRAFT_1459778 [Mucidula mucida]|nr:hypothetical protein CPB85DRAFT_1459778 [Mucidula mucida]
MSQLEETPPHCGPVLESADVPVAAVDSTDKVSENSESPAIRYVVYTFVSLYLTYLLDPITQCPPTDCTDEAVRLAIIWGVVHLVLLAVAASPLLEDRWFDHGKFYVVYQAAVIAVYKLSVAERVCRVLCLREECLNENRMRNIRASADRGELFSKVEKGPNGDTEKLVEAGPSYATLSH